jgi:S-methylmethionine-dependent homocysteine/selenocysteine methylase
MKDYQQIEPINPAMWAASQNKAKPDPVPAPHKHFVREAAEIARTFTGIDGEIPS